MSADAPIRKPFSSSLHLLRPLIKTGFEFLDHTTYRICGWYFTNFCKSDPQLSVAHATDPFLQGSVATRTAVRPLSSDGFDVDVIPVSSVSVRCQIPQPSSIIHW